MWVLHQNFLQFCLLVGCQADNFLRICDPDQTSYFITSPIEKLCSFFVSAKYLLFILWEFGICYDRYLSLVVKERKEVDSALLIYSYFNFLVPQALNNLTVLSHGYVNLLVVDVFIVAYDFYHTNYCNIMAVLISTRIVLSQLFFIVILAISLH